MFKKDYCDLKMFREFEFEVVFEIAVEYQAEKVVKMAEKRLFLNQAKFESSFEKKRSHIILRKKIRGVSFLSFSKF